MRLFKPLAIGALVLVLAGAVLPWYFGAELERHVRNSLDAALMMGTHYEVEVDRGYLQSRYRISHRLDEQIRQALVAEGEPAPVWLPDTLTIELFAWHGPWLTRTGPGLGLADLESTSNESTFPELARLFDDTGIPYISRMRGRIDFGGGGDLYFDTPEFQILQPRFFFDFGGLQGHVRFEDWGRLAVTNFSGSGFNFRGSNDAILGVNQIDFHADMEMADSRWMPVGDSYIRMERVIAGTPLDEAAFDNLLLRFGADQGSAADNLIIEYGIELDRATLSAGTFENVGMLLSYDNISIDFLDGYFDLVEATASLDAVERQTREDEFMLDNLPEFLSHDPGISVSRLTLTQEGQSLDASLNIRVRGDSVDVPQILMSPFFLISSLEADLEVRIHEQLAMTLAGWYLAGEVDAIFANNPDMAESLDQRDSMIQQRASMLMSLALMQGFAQREDVDLVTRIELRDSSLNLNGVEMPLPF